MRNSPYRLDDSLLLDTHVALWLDSGDRRLRAGTRDAFDELFVKRVRSDRRAPQDKNLFGYFFKKEQRTH
jgi:hypothetical protein